MIGFVDIETTGLDPTEDDVLEVACIVTDDELSEVDSIQKVVYQPESSLDEMDEWCQETHSKNGLIEDIRQEGQPLHEVEEDLIGFLDTYASEYDLPMGGSSVHFDREFLNHHMEDFASMFHYRNIDVSSLKELVKRWEGSVYDPEEDKTHRALDDIRETIEELNFYREQLNF